MPLRFLPVLDLPMSVTAQAVICTSPSPGIGVRASIYVQALLCFGAALTRQILGQEGTKISPIYRNHPPHDNIFSACIWLFGMPSACHAIIVLNLCWISNLTFTVYASLRFLASVYHNDESDLVLEYVEFPLPGWYRPLKLSSNLGNLARRPQ